MTAPPPTYGEFMQAARAHSAHAALHIELDNPRTIADTAQTRTRLYRLIAGALETHTPGVFQDHYRPQAHYGRGERLGQLLSQVQADLTRTVVVTDHILDVDLDSLPGQSHLSADTLRQAYDNAGAAFDILGTHLGDARIPRSLDAEGLRFDRDLSATVLTDALSLAHDLTRLDSQLARSRRRLEQLPNIGQQLPGMNSIIREAERLTAIDTRRFVSTVHEQLRPSDRGGVDHISLVTPPPADRMHVDSPAAAATAIDALRTWAYQHNQELLSVDLANIAAVARTSSHLTAATDLALNHGEPTDLTRQAHQAANDWAHLYRTLDPMVTIDRRAFDHGIAGSFRAWAKPYLSRGHLAADIAGDPARAEQWLRAAQTISARLPDLAELAHRSVYHQQATDRLWGKNLEPDLRMQHRYNFWRFIYDDPRIPPVSAATSAAATSSTALARTVLDTYPQNHSLAHAVGVAELRGFRAADRAEQEPSQAAGIAALAYPTSTRKAIGKDGAIPGKTSPSSAVEPASPTPQPEIDQQR